MSSFVFMETLMTHLLLWGNAYSQIIRNGKGQVVGLDGYAVAWQNEWMFANDIGELENLVHIATNKRNALCYKYESKERFFVE